MMTNFMKNPMNSLILIVLVLVTSACQQKAPINRLQEWDRSMLRSVVQARNWCTERIKTIKQEVKKSGNPSVGLEYIKRAEALDKYTFKVLSDIDKLKVRIIHQAAGGVDTATYLVKKPFEVERVKMLMKKHWPDLKKRLNSYADFINKSREYLDDNAITCDFFKLGEAFKGVNFYQLYFEEATAQQTIMSLNALQVQVMSYESKVLAKFGFDGSPL